MGTGRPLSLGFCIAAVLILAASVACAQSSDEPLRALVVDRSDDILWLGLPAPVKIGSVFDIMLVPGAEVIARAVVIDCTPDSPYVARAKYALEDPKAFIPVGAYAEAMQTVVAGDRDRSPGYGAVTLGSPGENPLSLTAGVFVPSKSSLRSETADIWPTVGVAYRLARTNAMRLYLGVAYYHGDGSFMVGTDTGTRRVTVVPFTVDARIGLGEKRNGAYILVGAGAYSVRDERVVGGTQQKASVTTFGWQAGVGWETKSGRYVQIKYTDTSRSDFRGVVFCVGARF